MENAYVLNDAEAEDLLSKAKVDHFKARVLEACPDVWDTAAALDCERLHLLMVQAARADRVIDSLDETNQTTDPFIPYQCLYRHQREEARALENTIELYRANLIEWSETFAPYGRTPDACLATLLAAAGAVDATLVALFEKGADAPQPLPASQPADPSGPTTFQSHFVPFDKLPGAFRLRDPGEHLNEE